MRHARILALLLAAALIAALACGCAPSAASPTSAPATSAPASPTSAATDAPDATDPPDAAGDRPMEGNLYLEGLPLVQEPETFTLFVDDSNLPEEKIMYPILEEATGVQVELILIPYEAATERLTIYLSSNDYPDVIGGWILNDNLILEYGMDEGLFIPIEEMINQYAPRLQEVMAIDGVEPTMTLPDGHVYTIPYAIKDPLVGFLPWINTKWLNDLGLEMPSTPDELLEVLRAFKENDPAGEGRTVPFSGDPNNTAISTFAGWWGVEGYKEGDAKYFSLANDQLSFVPATDGYKEAVKYFNVLWDEGLLDPEFFTQDINMWKAKGKSHPDSLTTGEGVFGVTLGYGSGDFSEPNTALSELRDRYDYDAMPVLDAGFNGAAPTWTRGSYGMTVYRTQCVVTDTAKNPATIIRWWDTVFQEEYSTQIQWGLLGLKLEKIGDKLYRSVPDSELTEEQRSKYEWGKLFTQSLPKYIPNDVVLEEVIYKEKDVADALYAPFLGERIPKAWVSEEQASRLSILETDIKNYITQVEAEWVTGQRDVEADWAGHLAQLEALGLPELTSIRQALYDSSK